MQKLLFVLKQQTGYDCGYSYSASSGLFNSAKFVVDMLVSAGVQAKLVEIVDNNSIDREVSIYKPTTVVIEALWVVPEKFDILKKLHPKVQWIVRLHSDIPFLATEGIAMDWIFGYLGRGVKVAFNSPKPVIDLRAISPGNKHKIIYLPNFYPVAGAHAGHSGDDLRVGCFGALRPMKNQLVQAAAAIRYADEQDQKLTFFVNASRCEQGGDNVLKNLRALFKNTNHTLAEQGWLDHAAFLKLMATMDVALCVSMSETFCITAADAIAVNTPLVCSSEIPWAAGGSIARTTDADDIVRKMSNVISVLGYLTGFRNRLNLKKYSERSKTVWLHHFKP